MDDFGAVWYNPAAIGTKGVAKEKRRSVGRDKILEAAESLFREHSFSSVSLADVARAVDIRKPSIYYHFPNGKEELFVAVQRGMFLRIGDELKRAMAEAEADLASQLSAASRWFLSRPPLFLLSMVHNDMPDLSEAHRKELSRISYEAIMLPLVEAARSAAERGELRDIEPHRIAGSFLALLEGNTITARAGFAGDLETLMHGSIDIILNGVLSSRRDV